MLKTTYPDTNIAKNLAFKAGLQDNTQGVKWEPEIRGFVEGDYFLIMKTFPDHSPDVRPGRAFSHVLMILKQELIQCADLDVVLSILPSVMNKNAEIKPIIIECAPSQAEEMGAGFLARFNKVIHGFVNHSNYNNTLIWVGQEDMRAATTELWRKLNREQRLELNFGIYFNTDNIDNSKLNFITIPEAIQSKFFNTGYLLINKHENYKPTGLAEEVFAGNNKALQRLEAFKQELGINEIKLLDLETIAKGLPTFESLDEAVDIKKVNTLAHIIAVYSPLAQSGKDYKSRLLKKLVQLLRKAKSPDIVILKNFKIESFEGAKDTLGLALGEWLNENVFVLRKPPSNSGYDILKIITTEKKSNWIVTTVHSQLSVLFNGLTKLKAQLLWHWLSVDEEVFQAVIKLLAPITANEVELIEAIPMKLSKSAINIAKAVASDRKWYLLHAHLSLKDVKPEVALQSQLDVDEDIEFLDGIRYIAKFLSQKILFEVTLNRPEPRLIELCIESCVASPFLLEALDALHPVVQQIMTGYSDRQSSSWLTNLKQPQKVVDALLNGLVSGCNVGEKLIEDIAFSDYACVLYYKNRKALWDKLPPKYTQAFLQKTSAKILEELSKDPETRVPDDKPLSDFILNNGISEFLYFNKNKLSSTLPIFQIYSNTPQSYIAEYLRNYNGEINMEEAKRIGILARLRKYIEVADVIYDRATKHNNWKYALAECYTILDIWKKARIAIKGTLSKVNIPTDEWWQITEEFIVSHYSNQSALVTIWRKAGGKEFELMMTGTTQDAWHDAIVKLRQGKIKKPSMNDLLKEMKKDYQGSETFELVFELRLNYIKKK